MLPIKDSDYDMLGWHERYISTGHGEELTLSSHQDKDIGFQNLISLSSSELTLIILV